MNASRRSRLALLGPDTMRSELQAVLDDEQEAFDNMPESLQSGERGETSQEWLDAIQEAIDGLDSLCGLL